MRILLFLFCCVTSLTSFAQQKLFTMQDAMVNARTTLAPQSMKQLQFVSGTEDFVYLNKTDNGEALYQANFNDTKGKEILSLSQLNTWMKAAGLDEVKTWPMVKVSKEHFVVTVKGKRHQFSRKDGSYKNLFQSELDNKEILAESHAGAIVYSENHNLYYFKHGQTQKLTEDGSEVIVYGRSVHQNEFGISGGTFWSNDGRKLAYYRMDQSMVPQYPIINWEKRPAVNEYIYYPMAGDKSHHVTLEIFNETKGKIKVQTGLPAEQYLTNIAWSPDDKYIFIAVLNRAQNHMKLNQYDATTGAFVKTLFEETDEKYTEPLKPMKFLKTQPDHFIWESRRDGWNHVYLYHVSGKLVKQLTSGNWEVTEVLGFDQKESNLYFASTASSPLNKDLHSVNVKSGNITRLTGGDMRYLVIMNEQGTLAITNASNINTPREITLIQLSSGKKKQLFKADNPLKDYQLADMRWVNLKSNDGFDLYGRLYTPTNFDSTKKYPVIVYWYGGPHAQLTLNAWNGGSGDLWFQYMAQRGYVVFTMDTRGSANRGKAFEQSIFRHAGKAQMEDLLVGVDYLKKLPFADAGRMGLFGWSYGGFMTTSFLLHHPGIFKVGVAGGPVMDWQFYEIMYTERYMDTPEENPEGYEATNLVKKAGQLKDKLLIIHGMQDPVVVMQHSVRFVKAAVDNNVQVDYMIYPGHEHNVLGKDRAHLYQKVTDYFMLHL